MPVKRLVAVALALAALLPAPALHAEIYRWTDAGGRVHFGDREPVAAPATRITDNKVARQERLTIRISDDDGVLDDNARTALDTGIRRLFDVYTGLFHLAMRRPVLVDIHLFRDAPALAAWVRSIDGKAALPANIYGLYMPQHNLVGAWRHDDDADRVIATLLHETSHVLLSQLSPNAPAWLQEGMAQYLEGLDTSADAIAIFPEPEASAAIDTWIRQKQLVTLRQYFSLDEARWRHLAHTEQNAIPYAVAWSVCYFLMSRPVGRQIIGELLQDLEKTKRAPTADAIERRYPGGYAVMEYDWFKWAQGEKRPQLLRW